MRLVALRLLPLLIAAGCSDRAPLSETLAGEWTAAEADGTDIVCPDILTFEAGGEYTFANSCFAEEAAFPLVERGAWRRSEARGEIILFDRDILTAAADYSVAERGPRLAVKVEHLGEDMIRLGYGQTAAFPRYYRRTGGGS